MFFFLSLCHLVTCTINLSHVHSWYALALSVRREILVVIFFFFFCNNNRLSQLNKNINILVPSLKAIPSYDVFFSE